LAPRSWYCAELEAAIRWADAVCIRVPSTSGIFAYNLARRLGKPLMFELIGDPFLAMQGPRMSVFGRAYGVYQAAMVGRITRGATVGSYVSYRHLQRRFPAASGVLTEPISSIRMSRENLEEARVYDVTPTPLKMVLTASLVPVKAHDVLIQAVAGAQARGADVTLDLLGGGPLQDALQTLARRLGVLDRVHFHGHVSSRERLNELIDGADLFVMTSVSEGMPRAMIEAMARGLPAIGTDAGGIAELLTPAQRVPVGDHEALGELIAALADNPLLLSAFARHSEQMCKDFLEDVLSERRMRLLTALERAARETSR
jgi:glycosyltransferase involved in cell wall biosynthesis